MSKTLFLPLLAAGLLSAAEPSSGLWDATITYNDVAIPFRMEIAVNGAKASGSFLNGEERLQSTSGAYANSALSLRFDYLNGKLDAAWDGTTFKGAYLRNGRTYPFEARRFAPLTSENVQIPNIAGTWVVQVPNGKLEKAWWLYVRQSGAEATASILRVDGDTGTLSGSFRDGKFVLSHFSGSRPAKFAVSANPDGTLAVIQNDKLELTAVRSDEARRKGLPEPADPSRHTSVKDPTERFRFSGKDWKTGQLVNETDPRWQGNVLLVSIGGTWCPNCHDEAPFLVELNRQYAAKGLRIVSLSFEEEDQLKDPRRLRAFVEKYGIQHTMLLSGTQEQISEVIPQAVNLTTWPATFFIGRDGRVKGVHAGFASEATGEEHIRLKAEVRHTIEKLLAETNSVSTTSVR
ncbi:hypothetical protein F183_A29260 [Bryobacterales bacterium F-183]|nr:hypothetical protein F183_A29260 [Bryobacterales bacterium F-183]